MHLARDPGSSLTPFYFLVTIIRVHLPAMENQENNDQSKVFKIPLIQDLRQTVQYIQTSPEFLTSIGVERVTLDPLSLSGTTITEKSEIIRDGGVLGHQKGDKKDNSAGSSSERPVPPFEHQDTEQKEAGAEVPSSGRVQEDALPAEGQDKNLKKMPRRRKKRKKVTSSQLLDKEL